MRGNGKGGKGAEDPSCGERKSGMTGGRGQSERGMTGGGRSKQRTKRSRQRGSGWKEGAGSGCGWKGHLQS
eukprot:2381695-Pleurochrysis_carterae.AAC.1